jgi:hypothetical protein
VQDIPVVYFSLDSSVVIAVAALVLIPLSFYVPEDGAILRSIWSFWSAFIHVSASVVGTLVAAGSFWWAPGLLNGNCCKPCSARTLTFWLKPIRACSLVSLVLGLALLTNAGLQMCAPSWLWNPFLWGTYRVYVPLEIAPALGDLCRTDYKTPPGAASDKAPLCLSSADWKTLSGGYLSSRNTDDVQTVRRGVQYAFEESGGLIVGVLSRDTVDAVEPLRMNIEGLVPFFPQKLSVVVYENDSNDGTREAFKKWASEAKGYNVDLISCGKENPDCKFAISHRYDSLESKDFYKSSAVGKMPEFRQKLLDYILGKPSYDGYSHFMVMDIDLAVSISPLGLLHTLGKLPHAPVASSGRETFPGSFGTQMPIYDTVATRFFPTPANQLLLDLHQKYCELAPAGDRWRFECENSSPFVMLLRLEMDSPGASEPYKVLSAFNGATLYPMKLLRESGARYDAGEDGQRCEHVGFNLSLKAPMYINPKWSFNVNPSNPAGPRGGQALKGDVAVLFFRRQSLFFYLQAYAFMFVFALSTMTVTLYLVYPISVVAWRRLLDGSRRPLPKTIHDSIAPFTSPVKRSSKKSTSWGVAEEKKEDWCDSADRGSLGVSEETRSKISDLQLAWM